MLRCADDAAIASGDPLQLASFPLVPYSNRIAGGTFDWQEQKFELKRNFDPEPHAIHGVGWQMPWVVTEQSETHCVLTFQHDGDSRWHWPFSAKQTFALTENALVLELETVNLHHAPTPLAFGHHPYFDQHGAYLAFEANQIYLSASDGLPTERVIPAGDFDFSKGEAVKGRNIDNCYSGWRGEARIVWKNRSLGLVITSDMPAAVVYIPPDSDAFCFEPVPHVNDALNRPEDRPAMPVIAPGSSFCSTITMTAIAAEQI
jgi:aldose 1-epimerase